MVCTLSGKATIFAISFVSFVLFVVPAVAATYTWNANASGSPVDGGGTWNTTSTNWYTSGSDGTWPNTSANVAVFGAGSGAGPAGPVTLGGLITTGSLTFNAPGSGAYSLTAGTLDVAGTTPTITMNASSGTIASVLETTNNLTMLGKGALYLTGSAVYTGTTKISGSGALYIDGGDSTSSITVNTGGTLGGSGSASSATVLLSNAKTTIDAGSGGQGSLTLASLNIEDSATLRFSNVGNYSSGVAAINVTGSNLFTLGGQTTTFSLAGAPPTGSGTAELLQCAGTIQGSLGNFNLSPNFSPAASSRAVFSLTTTSQNGYSYIDLNYNTDYPVWTGSGDCNWVTSGNLTVSGTTNWVSALSGTATNFIATDSAVFADTFPTASGTSNVASSTVNINSGNVSPSAVTFNNNLLNYTISSSAGYGIAGTGPLTMKGSAAVTITNANSYSGGTTVYAGSLSATGTGALGTGPLVQNGGTVSITAPQSVSSVALNAGLLNVNSSQALGSGTLTLSGGTIDNASGGPLALSNSPINWNGSFAFGGSNSSNNSLSLGSGSVALSGSSGAYLASGATLSVAGAMTGGDGISQSGAGLLVLTGSSNYTGATNVSGGTLQVGSGGSGASIGGTSGLTIATNAALVFSHNNSMTFTAPIGGSGSLVESGGTLTLPALNSPATAVVVNSGGVLNLTNSAQTIGSLSSTDGLGSQVLVGSGTLSVGNSASTVFDGAISGGGGSLVKQGSGTLVFTGNNTYTGITTISAGRLQLGDGAVKNGSVSGNIVNNAAVVFANPASLAFGGVISGSGSLTKTGAGVLSISTNQIYSGPTIINGGILRLNSAAAVSVSGFGPNTIGGTGSVSEFAEYSQTNGSWSFNSYSYNEGYINTPVTSGVLDLTDGPNNPAGMGAGNARTAFCNTPVPVNASFTTTFTYTPSSYGTNYDNGFAFVLQNDSRGLAALAGPAGGYGVGIDPDEPGLGAGPPISPSAEIVFDVFQGSSPYGQPSGAATGYDTNGGTTTNTSIFGGNNYVPGDPINVTVSYNAQTSVLAWSGTDAGAGLTFSESKSGINLQSATGGSSAYIGFGGADGYFASSQTISNFSFSQLGGGGANLLPATTPLTMTGGTLDLNGSSQTIASLSGSAAAVVLDSGVLTTGGNNTSTTFDGAISGSGALYKVGSGTFTLAGSSTLGGGANVNAGVLQVNGSLAAAVTVNSGGMLSGMGTLTSATISSGGTLSPGDAPGQLTLTGSLTLVSGAKLDFKLDTPSDSDEIFMSSGTLVLGSQQFSDFTFTPLAGFGPGTYDLIDAGSVIGSLASSGTNGFIDGFPASIAEQGNEIVLNVVPEPATLMLLLSAVIAMLGFRGLANRHAQNYNVRFRSLGMPRTGVLPSISAKSRNPPMRHCIMLNAIVLLLLPAIPAGLALAEDETPSADAPLPVTDGPYHPSMDSLKQYKCPDWFRDAKFGIWAHWGPQAVPMDGDWYARGMYEPGNKHYKYQLEHYGHPSKFGYKDIIPLWKAEKWDPDRLMQLYKKAGAKYFVSMGSHHDNFFLWNSKLHKWNAVNMGPKRDVVGDWQKAAQKYGLKFGVSEHLGASFTWFQSSHKSDKTGPFAGVPYDGANPEFQDLYHFPAKPGDTGWYSNDPRWQREWYAEIKELVDNYHPDLLYSDGGVPFGNYVGLSMIAHYYNTNAALHGGTCEAIYNCKQKSDGRWVEDLERGIMPRIEPNPWQTDTSIGDWFYDRNYKFRPVVWVIHMLVDNVSKNGNLLLNVVQRPDGSLDPEVEDMLAKLAAWTAIHGEAIYGSRPWLVYGESAVKVKGGSFGENYKYNAHEIRFTTQRGADAANPVLYAIALGWPEDRTITIRSLAKPAGENVNNITAVSLLGYRGKLHIQWKQTAEGLVVTLPEKKVSEYTAALKIIGTDLKPVGSATPTSAVRPDKHGRYTLTPDAADMHGSLHAEDRASGSNIGFWDNADDSVSWNVDFAKPGAYGISAMCALPAGETQLAVDVDGKTLLGHVGHVAATGGWDNYKPVAICTVEIAKPSMKEIKLRPANADAWRAINLREVKIVPVK